MDSIEQTNEKQTIFNIQGLTSLRFLILIMAEGMYFTSALVVLA